MQEHIPAQKVARACRQGANGGAHAACVGRRHPARPNKARPVPAPFAVPEGEGLQRLRNHKRDHRRDERPARQAPAVTLGRAQGREAHNTRRLRPASAGGPPIVHEPEDPNRRRQEAARVLGICFGHQVLCDPLHTPSTLERCQCGNRSAVASQHHSGRTRYAALGPARADASTAGPSHL